MEGRSHPEFSEGVRGMENGPLWIVFKLFHPNPVQFTLGVVFDIPEIPEEGFLKPSLFPKVFS